MTAFSFFSRFIFAICLVSATHVFASAWSTVVALDESIVARQAPSIRARMGFEEGADASRADVSKILVLDSNNGDHMDMVVAALTQTNDFSQITKCEYPLVIGHNLESFIHLFYKEKFDVVTSSLNGYLKEEHDFAFLFAMARQFPQTHFVLAIGNQQTFNPHYSYPLACEELLESVKHQLTFAIWSQQCEGGSLEKPSPGSYLPQDMSMRRLYEERSIMAPGELGDMAGSSFSAPRIAGCIARLKEVYGVTSNEAASFLHQRADKSADYTPGGYGSGGVRYAKAAHLAAAHAPSPSPPSEAPDFGKFLTDYHTFQCLAASKNPSHLFMAFQNPTFHHVTRFLHTKEEEKLCVIAPEDASYLFREIEKFFIEEFFSFDQFAHTLIDSPLHRDYPGCASYMFLKHYENPDDEGNPNEKNYLSCLDEAKRQDDFVELASMSHSDGHLDVFMACLERLSLECDSEETAALYENLAKKMS